MSIDGTTTSKLSAKISSLEGLTDKEREFQDTGPGTENALVPVSVLTLGTFSNESSNLVDW